MFNPVSAGVNMLANLLAEQRRLAECHPGKKCRRYGQLSSLIQFRMNRNKKCSNFMINIELLQNSGADGTRTRDPGRDRPVF